MRQFKKEWSAQWNGHIIRVENRIVKRGHFETHLTVDGALIQQCKGDCWHPNIGCAGEFEDENGKHNIRIKSAFLDSTAAICHIYIDEELIGGDTQTPMPLTEEDIAQLPIAEQKKRLKRAILGQSIGWLALMPLSCALFSHFLNVELLQAFIFSLSSSGYALFNVLSNVYRLLKLSLQNPDKNSTPV